jgi:hypothetical protein
MWINGSEGCCVGMVSQVFAKLYGNILDGRIVKITKICAEEDSESMRHRSAEHGGMAFGVIIS